MVNKKTVKTTVIYHSADYDGIFCREIARKFLPNAELIGWNFGDPMIPFPKDGTVYVLDLSPDCLIVPLDGGLKRVIWIDHHKTSIEKWTPHFCNCDIPGYRIDGVAACRLAWQWFVKHNDLPTSFHNGVLSVKEEFIEHRVSEPLAVRLAGEYDVWDKRDPDAEIFQFGLRVEDELKWEKLLSFNGGPYVTHLLQLGATAQKYAQKNDASICKTRTWLRDWEGLRFLCVNTARFNSLFFAAKDLPETGHDALLGFCWTGQFWTVSLYHAKHRTDLDLSEIAKKHGGGGHQGACGFTCKELPFSLYTATESKLSLQQASNRSKGTN